MFAQLAMEVMLVTHVLYRWATLTAGTSFAACWLCGVWTYSNILWCLRSAQGRWLWCSITSFNSVHTQLVSHYNCSVSFSNQLGPGVSFQYQELVLTHSWSSGKVIMRQYNWGEPERAPHRREAVIPYTPYVLNVRTSTPTTAILKSSINTSAVLLRIPSRPDGSFCHYIHSFCMYIVAYEKL